VAPPPNNYPQTSDGTLVTSAEAQRAFPPIPDVTFPPSPNPLKFLDFGPQFGRHGGVLSLHPPLEGESYPVLVPKADRDGLDIAGIRIMPVAVPFGTSTGWNVRAEGSRAPNLCGLSGSYIPFARNVTEKARVGDPRKSLEERYRNHAGFVAAVEKAARDLVRARFLHPEDAERYLSEAKSSDILRSDSVR
jgi:hypothetical protein